MKTILILLSFSFAVSMASPITNEIKYQLTNLVSVNNENKEEIIISNSTIDVDAQIALILDTSGSMSGLIEQAKSQLWNIVNELSVAKKDSEPINFQIALYEYGNDNIPEYKSYVRQIAPFTSDIDLISEKLFSLNTYGGEEYCGAAIGQSLSQLNWSTLANLKTIYIAGNESFDQGNVSYRDVCTAAQQNNISVNTIFCGPKKKGIGFGWKKGANLGEGKYFNIDHNYKTVYYDSPYDTEIADLNDRLNDTYIHYGSNGKDFMINQRKQDDNAKVYGRSNFASRSVFKSNTQYNNAKWDLVDAYEQDDSIIEKAKDLPEEYQDLSREQLRKRVAKIAEQRKEIQSKISDLGLKRKTYIDQMKKKNSDNSSLNNSINTSLRSQAVKAGLIYEDYIKQPSAKIDFIGFMDTSSEVYQYRKDRLIGSSEFIEMSMDKNTIILDTRSKEAYNQRHVKGSIHLNFSDFTKEKLKKLIPDQNTRILIYCNNNFISKSQSLLLKAPPLALNIPTFINLYGYGYKNIYELNSLIKDDNSILKMSKN